MFQSLGAGYVARGVCAGNHIPDPIDQFSASEKALLSKPSTDRCVDNALHALFPHSFDTLIPHIFKELWRIKSTVAGCQ
jgi:hypothetical protein